jgi:cytochrome P450
MLDARLAGIDPLIADEVQAMPLDTSIDLELAMARIALVLAAWVLFGERLDGARAETIALHQRDAARWIGDQLGSATGFVPVAVGRRARVMREHTAVLNAYVDEVIARARAHGHPDDDLLGALLRSGMDSKRLRGHVLGFFLAGNETTAAALAWTMVQGAAHAGEWAKVRADPNRWTMPFIDETLRLTPAVWGVPRVAAVRGAEISAGGVSMKMSRSLPVTIYTRGMQRSASVWADPLRFDPARHLAEDKEQQRSLIPFGLGPRGCIGQHLALAEMGIVLPALARRGTFTIDGPTTEDARFALRVGNGLTGRFVPAVADPVAASDGQA